MTSSLYLRSGRNLKVPMGPVTFTRIELMLWLPEVLPDAFEH